MNLSRILHLPYRSEVKVKHRDGFIVPLLKGWWNMAKAKNKEKTTNWGGVILNIVNIIAVAGLFFIAIVFLEIRRDVQELKIDNAISQTEREYIIRDLEENKFLIEETREEVLENRIQILKALENINN